jgi:hypothetical protein
MYGHSKSRQTHGLAILAAGAAAVAVATPLLATFAVPVVAAPAPIPETRGVIINFLKSSLVRGCLKGIKADVIFDTIRPQYG